MSTTDTRNYSFEFFPPKTPQGVEKLQQTREELGRLKPAYFSVTFGAGGSTQEGTLEVVSSIQQAGFEAAPHLSCIGSTQNTIRAILGRYQELGIKRLVALRGDMPSGTQGVGDFRYANELIEFVRLTTGTHFHIEVAAYPEVHPQAKSPEADLLNFKRKVDAGANSAITQYFFSAAAYYRFVEDCRRIGIDIPIVPGIMPITNYTQLARFSDLCGAEIPRWIRLRLKAYEDDRESLTAFGTEVVTQLCADLLDNDAPGLHFYTMNQVTATRTIWENLKLS